jgi:hypothetical protein
MSTGIDDDIIRMNTYIKWTQCMNDLPYIPENTHHSFYIGVDINWCEKFILPLNEDILNIVRTIYDLRTKKSWKDATLVEVFDCIGWGEWVNHPNNYV